MDWLRSVQIQLSEDPFSGHLFVFRGRRGDRLKILWWSGDGLCLFYKRLEQRSLRVAASALGHREPDECAVVDAAGRHRLAKTRSLVATADCGVMRASQRSSRANNPTAATLDSVRHARDLPNDIETLKRLILEQQALIDSHALEIERLRVQLSRLRQAALRAQLRRSWISRSSNSSSRWKIWRAWRALPDPAVLATPRARRPIARCTALAEHLPREPMVHEAPVASGCTCPDCGGPLRAAGEDVTEILERIPARYKVVRHVRPKFSCASCETLLQAPAPNRPIERGMVGASVLAHVLVSKYCDHLPPYRQSQIYEREGVELSRSTLADWVGQSTALLDPLVNRIAQHVMQAVEAACR